MSLDLPGDPQPDPVAAGILVHDAAPGGGDDAAAPAENDRCEGRQAGNGLSASDPAEIDPELAAAAGRGEAGWDGARPPG